MFKVVVFSIAVVSLARAEVVSMTLREAMEMALKQNPDVAMARLDQEKAQHAIRVARDPFTPSVTVGSGIAYSNGFPLSIEGSAPSIIQAKATQFLFNRPQSYAVAQARENARGAQLTVEGKREEVAYRAASLYLEAERAARIGSVARRDAESLERVLATVQAQVREGRALPLAEKQASLALARARQSAESLEGDQAAAETSLAVALGLGAQDRVRPAAEERGAPMLPASEEEALQAALSSSKELRQLQSQIASKGLEIRGIRAARLPRADLIAQYALLGKYNNYDQYFQKFQRNNGEIGVALQLPLIPGQAIAAEVSQTQTEIEHLRIEMNATRDRIASDIQQSFRDVKKAATAAQVAGLDLDVTREQLSVVLAQMQEGRATLRQVEEARVAENAKWIAFYDAQYTVEKANWNLLRLSGGLVAAVEGRP